MSNGGPRQRPTHSPEREPLVLWAATAQHELDIHVDDRGLCAVCGSTWPCERAELAACTPLEWQSAVTSASARHESSAHD